MHRRPKIFIAVATGVMLATTSAILGQPPRSVSEQWWALIVAIAAGIIFCYATFPYWAARRAFLERRRKTAAYRAEISLKRLADSEDISFGPLFAYNRRQLDAYQEESRNQQRSAFHQAQFASAAGLTVIIVGIAASLSQSPGSDQYVVAGLAGLGALLSGFIANTFASSARQANQQLNLYYREPHMVGRMMVAERLAHRMCGDDRSEQAKAMIAQMLAWPLPGNSDTADQN
jgi:hypothetical protein